ncbi:dipeptide/oligopeptide/nickel ABC transporter permease/ATP-binding protein (plasmid) [Aminobacter sp. SR38]|jgi:peptide/nickel transport system permease protein|uniref:ATP-binding cassette domain-containing protein n=1 Tax=Aminobacter sp. SR38 TaxID=2774562 RepID=UPI00177DC7F6|nr:dipeptide/oligopeptide/nickel ABC transporter permease/ATP-binding protein [Aminobacter sp. SR38]QOF75506.1 dipeptide/oligopeptide/nickel ABC transporter permease/ATP-binding protein [Aminobacter sp. SR38]
MTGRLRNRAVRWLQLDPSIVAIGIILFIAVFGRLLSPFDPEVANPATRLLPPSWIHLFGTDENGIDVFSRILTSFRIDVFVALLGTLLSVGIGAPLGVVLGYVEGRAKSPVSRWTTELSLRIVDIIQAFPVFILAMVLVSAAGSSIFNIIAAIAFVNGPVFLRLVRSEMLALRRQPFAEAAVAIGASTWRVGFVHLLPNALPTIIAQVSVTIGFSILLTAGLSFVGAGIDPPTPELGAMIASGAKFMILGQWWPSLFPGVALGLIVFWFANGGDRLANLLTPKRITRAERHADISPAPAFAQVSEPYPTTSLSVKELTVQVGGRALVDNVSFALAQGERVAIVGAAGAGKSLLVQALVGTLQDQPGFKISGRISVGGEDFGALTPAQRRDRLGTVIAPVFSNGKSVLNPMVRVGDFMRLALAAHTDLVEADVNTRLIGLLREVGISDPERRLRAFPSELSGGMAQRVCIALALMHRPSILITDEPTAGLDVTVQRQVLDLMTQLAVSHGMAQLIVTRDLGIAAHYCDRIIVMHAGRIVETAKTKAIFKKPESQLTRTLFEKSGVVFSHAN